MGFKLLIFLLDQHFYIHSSSFFEFILPIYVLARLLTFSLSLLLTLSLSGVHVFARTWFFHYYFILRTFSMTMVCVSCCCCCVYPLNSSKSPLSIETDSNRALCIFNVEFHNFESNSIFRPSRFSRLVEMLFNIIPLARFIDHALDYIKYFLNFKEKN